MAWIEFHATRIVKLQKFKDFRTALQMSKHEALGVLGSFWCEVLELKEDGDITDWTPEYLNELLGLKLSPERVWSALEAGWVDEVDGRKIVHDWWDTAGTYLTSRYKTSNPEKLHTIREKLSVGTLKTSLRNPLGILPNPTIPNQPNLTKPTKRDVFTPPTLEAVLEYKTERGSIVDPQGFIDFYASKGWMVGKNKMKDWKAAFRNAEGWDRWTIKKSSSYDDIRRQRAEADQIVEQFRQEQRGTGASKTV